MNAENSQQPDDKGASIGARTEPKTADRPHRVSIMLGLLSPTLALISLGVSFYVFEDSRESTRIAQRAYPSFHFESAILTLEPGGDAMNAKAFRVRAVVTVRNIGNTPAYIDSVRKELHAIDGDNMSQPIGGMIEESPNFDALESKGEPLPIAHDAKFSEADLTGDRSVVYEFQVRWHDAFGEQRPPIRFCTILAAIEPDGRYLDLNTVVSAPGDERKLTPTRCIKGLTVSAGSS